MQFSTSRRIITFVLIFASLLLTGTGSRAYALFPEFNERHPVPVGISEARDVVVQDGTYIIYTPGYALVSKDGATWTHKRLFPSLDPWQVVLGSQFVALTYDGLYASKDGIWWKHVLKQEGLTFVIYENEQYLTGGINGLWTSADGNRWTKRTSVGVGTAAFGQGRYVAAKLEGGVLISADGSAWTEAGEGVPGPSWIVYGDGRFVTVSTQGEVATSEDGTTWTVHRGLDRPADGLAFGNGKFVTGAVDGLSSVLLTSEDGATWTERPFPADGQYFFLHRFTGGKFFGRLDNAVYISEDGNQWTLLAGWNGGDLHSTAFGQGRWVTVGDNGTILTSPDGVNWTPRHTGVAQSLNAVAYSNGLFVAVSDRKEKTCQSAACSATILTSRTGLNWTAIPVEADSLKGVAYGNGRWVAVGFSDILTSADGVTWRKVADPPGTITQVTYGGGRFVAFGYGKVAGKGEIGYAYVSDDGETWSATEIDAMSYPDQVAYGGGRFVAVGDYGLVMTSTDGKAWHREEIDADHWFNGVAYSGSQFVATSVYQYRNWALLLSKDGTRWTAYSAPTLLYKLTFGDGRFMTTGINGIIMDLPLDGRQNVNCAYGKFPDVPDMHPGCYQINFLERTGAITGTGDGTFQPDRPITRAEFAKMIATAWTSYYPGAKTDPNAQASFTDVEGHWSFEGGYIQKAVALGMLSGFPDGTFRPDEPITRAQLVKVAMSRVLKPGGTPAYRDVRAEDWYAGWVAAAYQARYIGPNSPAHLYMDDVFHGDEPATRGEAAALLGSIFSMNP